MSLKLRLVKSKMRQVLDSESALAPVSTLTTSEYWVQSIPDDLRQEISRQIAESRTNEEIVKAITSERLQFKILWNLSLAVNQLPTKLLTQIFSKAGFAQRLVVTSEGRTIKKPCLTFWRLMMVCRHWREVIIGTPAFWSLVDIGSTGEWTELCLSRSLEASVDVYAQISHYHSRIEHFRDVYPLVQNRIRSLYLEVRVVSDDTDPDVLAALPVLFGGGMPVVEARDFLIIDDWRQPYHLPIDLELTCKRFPRIRHLALTGIMAPRAASLYRQLRTLFLTTCTYKFSCDHFLGVLASCTELECLYLRNTLDYLEGDWEHRDAVPWQPLISLPRLGRFSLIGHGPVRTSRFLAQFRMGPSVRLSILADAEDTDVDPQARPDSSTGTCSLAAMLPSNDARSTLAPLNTATKIHMCMGFADGVKITSDPPALALVMRLPPYIGRVLSAPPPRWGSATDLVRFLGHSPLTSLMISQVLPDTVDAWAGVFRTFVCLERLGVSGFLQQSPVGMEQLFLGLHAASAGDAGALLACPSLTHVKATCTWFTPAYEAIHACIHDRRDRGAVLVDLDLDMQCNWSLYRTHARDFVGCTERLRLGGRSADEEL